MRHNHYYVVRNADTLCRLSLSRTFADFLLAGTYKSAYRHKLILKF